MTTYKCRNCGIDVKRDTTGQLWMSDTVRYGPQYCWMDPALGSQLHDVNPIDLSGPKEIWLVASFQGAEIARLYVSEFFTVEELDLYNDNGSPKKGMLANILPRGCEYAYIVVMKPQKKGFMMETASEVVDG